MKVPDWITKGPSDTGNQTTWAKPAETVTIRVDQTACRAPDCACHEFADPMEVGKCSTVRVLCFDCGCRYGHDPEDS